MGGPVAGYADQYVGRAARRPQLGNVRLWLLVEVALIVAVLAVLQLNWVGFVLAGVVTLALLILLVPVRGNTVPRWIGLRIAYRRRQRRKAADPDVPFSLVPLAEWSPQLTVMRTLTGRGGEVGVITDGAAWIAVLAFLSDDELIADTGEELNLDSLTSLTVQDDVVFDGVQLVTYTVPAPTSALLGEGSLAAASYREILGREHPPPTVRRSWLCVRLDPRKCLGAVARRGTGSEGINATLRFGLHRAQSILKRQGIETRVLDPVEISEVLALTAGSGPEDREERTSEDWASWTCDGLEHRGQLVTGWGDDPSRGYAEALSTLAGAPVLFSVASFTLSGRRATGAIRLACPTGEDAVAAVRYLTDALDHHISLRPPGGMQVPVVLATVPFGRGVPL
jgi:type VII secretion protein EccE